MTTNQIKNILEFKYLITLEKLSRYSDGYILEKFDRYIDIDIKNPNYKCMDYQLWELIWKKDDKRINSIINFVTDNYSFYISDILRSFKEFINDDVSKINDTYHCGLHPILKNRFKELINCKENKRFIKLNNILNDKY